MARGRYKKYKKYKKYVHHSLGVVWLLDGRPNDPVSGDAEKKYFRSIDGAEGQEGFKWADRNRIGWRSSLLLCSPVAYPSGHHLELDFVEGRSHYLRMCRICPEVCTPELKLGVVVFLSIGRKTPVDAN